MQAIFCAVFYFVAIPIFNGMLMLGYSTLFTLLPVFSLVLDEDISREIAFKYPILY
jgi:phospholipid-translocating ATPase